jgi:hypothetical protein
MQDVVNTENTLMAELRHSRKVYGEAMVEYSQTPQPPPQTPQLQPAQPLPQAQQLPPAQAQAQPKAKPPMQRMRNAVDSASNACVLSKMQITVPPPKKPDIQKPPIP